MYVQRKAILSSKLDLPEKLKVADTEEEFRKVWQLREIEFRKRYPSVTAFKNDVYDVNACVLFGQNTSGKVTSTGRIAFDGRFGLPADEVTKEELDKLRDKGLTLAESGKFTITPEAKGIMPLYFTAYLKIAVESGIDSVIFTTRDKNVRLHQRTMAARVLLPDIGYSYGTNFKFSLLECRISEIIPTYLEHWGTSK